MIPLPNTSRQQKIAIFTIGKGMSETAVLGPNVSSMFCISRKHELSLLSSETFEHYRCTAGSRKGYGTRSLLNVKPRSNWNRNGYGDPLTQLKISVITYTHLACDYVWTLGCNFSMRQSLQYGIPPCPCLKTLSTVGLQGPRCQHAR